MGTHPIFESDFDCLTEKKNQNLFVGQKITKNKMRKIFEEEFRKC